MKANPDTTAELAAAWLTNLGYHVERLPEGPSKTCDLRADHPTGQIWIECKQNRLREDQGKALAQDGGCAPASPGCVSRPGLRDAAKRLGFTDSWDAALLDLTALSPSILKAALTGALPATVTLKDLCHAARHLDWKLQERAMREA